MKKRHPLDSLDDDIRDHIERETQENLARGMPAQEARRAAARRFGRPASVREDARAVWIPPWFDQIRREIRQTARSLAQSPGYLAAGVLTFGLTIGANAAIFAAVHVVLLSPLPIRNPDRLVVGWETNPARNQTVVEIAYQDVEEWRSTTALESVAAFGSSAWSLPLEDRIDPIRMASVGVSSNFFDTLGAQPYLGRFFRPEDDRTSSIRPLVMSHRLWRTRFGADPTVVGTTFDTGDGPAEVIGVAPADLDFPRGVDVWLPVVPVLATVEGIDGFRDIGVLFAVARVRDGLSARAAATDLERIAGASTARGSSRFGTAVRLTPFLEYQLGPVRAALWWLWAAVTILLLVACGNVAALMLARSVQRKREFALRVALGANRTALGRSVLVESMLISAAGGVAGLVAAPWILAVLVALAPDDVPRLADASVSLPVVLFTFGIILVGTTVTSAAPMLQSMRLSMVSTLNDGVHTVGRRSTRLRASLLVGQIALSVLLTITAGLILRSYVNLHQLDLGFRPDHVVTLEVDSRRAGSAYNEWVSELISRIEGLPDVESAGAAHVRPLAPGAIGSDSSVVLEGQPNSRQSAQLNPLVNYLSVTPGYFSTMRIRLSQGRLFTADDHSQSPRVVIVSETTARRLWPNEDPLGRRLSLLAFSEGDPADSWRTVIGIVGDVRYRGLEDVRLDVYEPASQSNARAGHVVVRSTRDGLTVAAAVQAEARRMEPRTIVSGITTMEAVVDRATATWTLSVWMFGLFAAAAMVLVCVGVFSTVSLDVARRSREFALRLALGARPSDVIRTAVSSVGVYVLAGSFIGLLSALLTAQLFAQLLFGTSPLDVITYVAVVVVTGTTSIAGCLFPLYRLAHIDPASELKRND